ncbi:lipase, partial [Dietzia sp. SLG510A3-3B2-2]|nr:lipase [Dietzia sp. SLG510A3-40A3]MBB1010347.1 lipase [Dietzia sp. SLG510A3-3B2-2]
GPVVAPLVPEWVDLQVVRLQDGCEVDRSGHLTVLASPRAVDLVTDALARPGAGPSDGSDQRPPRCVPADQLLGVQDPVPAR